MTRPVDKGGFGLSREQASAACAAVKKPGVPWSAHTLAEVAVCVEAGGAARVAQFVGALKSGKAYHPVIFDDKVRLYGAYLKKWNHLELAAERERADLEREETLFDNGN